MRVEQTIIHHLINNDEYCRKVLPFLDKKYFSDISEKTLIEEIVKYYDKYNSLPSKEVLVIGTSNRNDLTESENREIQKYIQTLNSDSVNIDWLIDETEKFVKDKAVYNAILDSITILDGKDKRRNKDSIPSLLSDALAISFDTDVGHDYLENAESRWEYYHNVDDDRIPFQLNIFNKITRGGLKKKTLNVAMLATGLGKSIFMCDLAANTLKNGKNVLYVTMEMPAEDIAERIDANLFDFPINEMRTLDKDVFLSKIDKIKSKTNGKLIVKEYPTGVHAGHFRALIEELKQKKQFKPDLLIIDYIGICGSQRLKEGGSVNSNTFMKRVSEELRDLGKEYNIPVFSGQQVNRSGQNNSDVDMENVAESIGLVNTLDFFFVMMAPEELLERNQYLVKQLKNRYGDVNYYKRFTVGIDKSRMRFYDVEDDGTYISDAGRKDEDEVKKPTSKKSAIESFNF